MEGRAHGSVRIASHPSHAARAAVTHKTQTRNPAAPIVRYGVESPLPSPLSYLLQLQPQLHLHLHCQALYKWQWSNSMTLCSLKLSYAPAVALRPSFGPSNNNQSPWSAPLPSPLLLVRIPISIPAPRLKIAHPAVSRIYVRFLI